MKRLLIIALLLVCSHASAISIQWSPLGAVAFEGEPVNISGSTIIEYKNAGVGGIDWNATGIGPRGGLGVQELWLFDDSAGGIPGTSEATTTFKEISNSVSFIMTGDHNDGFAQFFVDNIDVGTFDLYQTGNRNLIVTGLDSIAHSLRILQLGEHNLHSRKGDVAILGGAAFNIISEPTTLTLSEPTTLALFLIASLHFIGRFNKSNRSNRY